MKSRILLCSLSAVAFAAALAVTSFAGEKETPVKFADLPAAVQKTITKEAVGGTIGAVTKEDENGKVAYEAKVTNGKRKFEVIVFETGKLNMIEEVIALADAPEAVQKAIHAKAEGGKLILVEKETSAKGKVIYEATIKAGGKTVEIEFSETGKVLETETKGSGDEK